MAAMSQSSRAHEAMTESLALLLVREYAAAMLSVLMMISVQWRSSGIRDLRANITFKASRREM